MPTCDRALMCILVVAMATGIGTGFVLLRPPELRVMEGESAIFTCSPLYTVAIPILERNGSVYHDPDRLSHSDHGLNTPQGFRQYQLSNVSKEDSSTVLRCYMGGFFSNPITLTVFVLPTVTGPSGEVALIEEDPLRYVFNYSVSGFPAPHSISWLRDGLSFNEGPRVSVINGNSLVVESPNRTDSGNYTIIAVSTVGQASLSLILHIVYNEFLELPTNVTMTTGGVVRLRCVHRFGWAYAWFSSQGPLYVNTNKVFVEDGGQTLLYGPVEHTDHLISIYCVVHIRHSDRLFVSSQATLTITSAPIVLAPPEKVVVEGSNVLLEFTIRGYPPPSGSSYLHNNQTDVENRVSFVGLSGLFISNVSQGDAGNYTLIVSNGLGQASNTTHLDILYAPVIAPRSEPIVAQVSKPITLSCGTSFHGNPSPYVTWATTFDLQIRTENGQLHIPNPQYSDSGVYQCSVTNSVGTASTYVTLLVLDPPGPPMEVRIGEVGAHWVVITWNPPLNQGSRPVTSYIVTVTPLTSESACLEVECEAVRVRVKEKVANVSGLVPGVRHVLVVSALSNGTSLQSTLSERLVITTHFSVPGVGSVSAVVSGAGRCVVTWTLAYSGGSPITHFHIQFQRTNDSYWRDLNIEDKSFSDYSVQSNITLIPPTQRSWEVSGLESLTLYEFRIRGVSGLGEGTYTQSEVPVLSHEQGVPFRPGQPQLTCWSEQGPCIHTQLSVDQFTVDLLVLVLANGDVISRHTFLNYTPTTELVLSNVTYRGELQFQVIARNSIGVSEPSIPSQQAREYVSEVSVAFGTAGPVVGALVGVVNCVVVVIALAMCGQMCYVIHQRRTIQSKIVVTTQVTDSPVSPRMLFMGNLRPSPDSDLELPLPRRPDHFVTIATATPPTPLSIVSMV